MGDECRKRHDEMMEMERKAKEKTEELGKRIGKHDGETKEGFKTTEEKIAKTDKEVAQVKEDLGKFSLETIGEGLNEVIEGKMEEVERRLVKCVETQCEKQGVLLWEQGGRIYPPPPPEADRAQGGPVSQGGVGGLPDAGLSMPSLGRVETAGLLA